MTKTSAVLIACGALCVVGGCRKNATEPEPSAVAGPKASKVEKQAQALIAAAKQAQARSKLEANATKDKGAAPQKQVWSFEDHTANEAPTGFACRPGTWRVVDYPIPQRPDSPVKVLAQQAKNKKPVFNVALADDTKVRDLDLSVRLKSIAGKIDQGGGVVWRAKDEKNYYIARFNPLEDNFRLYFVKNGKRKMLKSANLKVPAGQWNTVRITMKDDQIECFFDGKKYLEVKDHTFSAAGTIGLWSKADAQTMFAELTLKPI